MTRSRDLSAVQNNLGVAIPPMAAGKNAVINGGFDIWQRGTSFSISSSGWTYTADRWAGYADSGTATYAQETTTVPSGQRYALKITAGGTQKCYIQQIIETDNTIGFAGQNITISMQVAANTSIPLTLYCQYSTAVNDWSSPTNITATSGGTATPTSTTYTTLTGVYAIPSTAKTLRVYVVPTNNMANTNVYYVGKAQFELGTTATPFSRAGGTIQGELAACQRYYWRQTADATNANQMFGNGSASSTTSGKIYVRNPVVMRVAPTSVDFSNITIHDTVNTASVTAISNSQPSALGNYIDCTSSGLTQYRPYFIWSSSSSGYLGFNAEL